MGKRSRTTIAVVLLVLSLLGVWDVKMASAAPSPAECKEEQRLGINACSPVLSGQQPSAACCQRVRVSHLQCICPAISPRLASRIGNDRFVRLVRGCGRSFPPRTKCGIIISKEEQKGGIMIMGKRSRTMVAVVLLVLALLGAWDVKMASAAPSPAECKEEQRLGIKACSPVLSGQQPSAACCQRVRVSHVECICPSISPRLASRIGNDRFVRLVRGCGRSFPPRAKCGTSPDLADNIPKDTLPSPLLPSLLD
ncbi:hypothetical protein RJ639_019936 [Escallonia herrerae]|uniref:Bifunctional inhibitor/plant lipid transfer protein/seed storage helical domain-containing protein n=1 Tax=Escallonia herrerae TaxID=1293975 RepID=A0AA88V626_9ASTE|nr:hypothetical protein RJ639_019936 [Escallonia herrerae]